MRASQIASLLCSRASGDSNTFTHHLAWLLTCARLPASAQTDVMFLLQVGTRHAARVGASMDGHRRMSHGSASFRAAAQSCPGYVPARAARRPLEPDPA